MESVNTKGLGIDPRLFHLLIEGLVQPVFVRDADGTIKDCNSAAAELCQKPAADICGKTLEDFTGATSAYSLSVEGITYDGKPATLVRVPDAASSRYPRWSQEFFDKAADIVFTVDLDGKLTWINRTGLMTGGFELADVIGKPINEYIVPEDAPLVTKMIKRKLDGDVTSTVYEVHFMTKDERRIPVEISSWLIYEFGKPVGVQGIARNVTEREHLLQQLFQSRQDEVIARLAGGVAHDFNNLLTVILGRSELLKGRVTPNHPLREEIDFISEAAERAAIITRQLLAFSRKQAPQPVVMDINALITKMSAWLQRLVGEHIRLETSLAGDLRAVRADPVQLEQVILNLALNAQEAMPKGGVFTIATAGVVIEDGGIGHETARPGPYIRLSITDTGIGIDASAIAGIFEPFSTTKKGVGFGLGLSTVQRIVSLAGGFTEVESEVGHGCTFRIFLPTVSETAGSNRPAPTTMPGGTETLLVVDDEPSLLALVSESLEMEGYTVLRAHSAEEALRVYDEHGDTIHLVLSDVVMQSMSGLELAEVLTDRDPQLKVLLMSGYPDEVLSHHGIRQGSRSLVEKPFTRTQIAMRVREVLDQK